MPGYVKTQSRFDPYAPPENEAKQRFSKLKYKPHRLEVPVEMLPRIEEVELSSWAGPTPTTQCRTRSFPLIPTSSGSWPHRQNGLRSCGSSWRWTMADLPNGLGEELGAALRSTAMLREPIGADMDVSTVSPIRFFALTYEPRPTCWSSGYHRTSRRTMHTVHKNGVQRFNRWFTHEGIDDFITGNKDRPQRTRHPL